MKLESLVKRSKKIYVTQEIDNYAFVWFTDGNGWLDARNNFEETFDVMQHIYNIKDLEGGIINKAII